MLLRFLSVHSDQQSDTYYFYKYVFVLHVIVSVKFRYIREF